MEKMLIEALGALTLEKLSLMFKAQALERALEGKDKEILALKALLAKAEAALAPPQPGRPARLPVTAIL